MDKLSDASLGEAEGISDYSVEGDDSAGTTGQNRNPKDSETGEDGRDPSTVTVAQASTQHVPTPPAGQQTTITVIPGVEYEFDFAKADADFVFSDGNLIILVHGGGEIILVNYGTEAAANNIPPLDFAGDSVGAFELLTETATAEQLADIQPAAGPGGAGAGNTGAAFSPYGPDPLPPGIPGAPPIDPTALAFGPPELTPFVFLDEEDEGVPPSIGPIDPVLVDEDDLTREDSQTGAIAALVDDCDDPPDFEGNHDTVSPGDDLPDPTSLMFMGEIPISWGTGGPGTIEFFETGQPELTSGGNELEYDWDAGTNTLTAFWVDDCECVHKVFTVEVTDVANGLFKFTLINRLDMPEGMDENNLVIGLNFEVTNGGGLSASGMLPVDIDDDMPLLGEAYGGTVDEDDLESPPATFAGNNDVAPGDDLPINSDTSVEGSFGVSFGADGPAAIDPIGNVTLTNVGLTSLGDAVTIVEDGGAWFGRAGGRDVFKLEFDADAGTYKFTLLDVLDHPVANTEDNITLDFTFTATDWDLDTVEGGISVTVDDDSPTITHNTDGSFVTHDETDGVQGAPDPNSQDDTAAALPTDFADRLTALGAGPEIGHANGNAGDIVINAGADGLKNAALTDSTGGALDGVDSGLDKTGGNSIFLYTDGVNDNIVLGREGSSDIAADPDGEIVFAAYLDEATGQIWISQFSAVENPSPGSSAADHDEAATVADAIYITATDNDDDQAVSGEQVAFAFGDDGPEVTVGAGSGSVSALALELDEGIDDDENDNPGDGADVYSAADSVPADDNGDLDDIQGQLAVDGTNPIGTLTTASGALSGLFNVITDGGQDGTKSVVHTFSLELSDGELATNLLATQPAEGGNPDADGGVDGDDFTQYVDPTIYLIEVDDTTIEGRVGGEDGPVALRITLNDPSDTVLGDETITVEQILAIDHLDDGNAFDSQLPLLIPSGSLSAKLSTTITDGDDDTDTDDHSVTLIDGNNSFVSFDDDGPVNNTTTLTAKDVREDDLNNAQGEGIPGVAGPPQATFTEAELAALVDPGTDGLREIKLNGAAIQGDDTGLDSKGFDVTYNVVSATQIDGIAAGDGNRVVFSITDDGAGNFTFELKDQVDHLPLATGGGDLETTTYNLDNVFVAYDGDFDFVVIDSGASVTIENDVPAARNDANVTVSGHVEEDGLDESVDESPPGADGDDLSTGNMEGGEDTSFDEDSEASGSLTALFVPGADEPLTIGIKTTLGADDLPVLWSQGHMVTYSSDGSTLTATADGRTVFTLTVNADGSWDFDLDDQLDHVDDDTNTENFDLVEGADKSGSVSAIDFSAILTATDFDGDSVGGVAAGFFTVEVKDDIPVQNDTMEMGVVEEEELTDGIEDTVDAGGLDLDETGPGGFDITTETVSGSLASLVSVGADEPLTWGLSTVTGGLPDVTSHGETVIYDVDGDTLTGYVDSGDSVGVLDDGDREVFTLEVQDDGDYLFTLLDILDHEDDNNNDENINLNLASADAAIDSIDFTSVVTATDFDGDEVSFEGSVFKIKIIDDTPVAALDTVESAMLVHDETPDEDGDADDVAFDDLSDQAKIAFTLIPIKGNDPDVGDDNGAIGYAADTLLTTVGGAFGADGPADSMSKVFSLSIVGGDDTDSGLDTTEGKNILLQLEGSTIVGRVDGDGNNMVDQNDPAAFAIHIDSTTGIVSVAQYLSIWHDDINDHDEADDDGTEPNDAGPVDDAAEQQTLAGKILATVTLKDFDDDESSASVAIGGLIKFEDDGPTAAIETVESAMLVHDETFGDDGDDDIAYASLTSAAQDAFDDVSVKGDDPDVGDDHDAIGYAADTLVSAASGAFGADGPAGEDSTVFSLAIADADSGLKTTEGQEIKLFLEDGVIVGRFDDDGGGTVDDVDADDPAAFAIHIGDGGVVSVAQYVSLFHDDAGDPDESNDDGSDGNDADPDDSPDPVQQTLAGKINAVVTITDGDGDFDSASVSIGGLIKFEDDGPTVTPSATTMGVVEEEHLPDGIEDTVDANNLDDDTGGDPNVTTLVASGSLSGLADFGADGPGGFTLDVIPEGAPQNSGLTSDGETVWYVSDGTTLTAFLDDNGTPDEFDGTDTVIFTLALSGANNADWTFTLEGKLDHHPVVSADDIEDTLDIDFSGLTSAVDADGDAVPLDQATFTVKVIDDVPVAQDDSATVTSGESVGGNLFEGDDGSPGGGDDDLFGADGPGAPKIISVGGVTDNDSVDGDPAVGSIQVSGANGTLTVDTDTGDYSYDATSAGQDTFAYEIQDGDGDSDDATLTIDVEEAESLLGEIVINEIGLGVGTSLERQGNEFNVVNTGVNFIEIRNVADNAIGASEMDSLSVEIMAADGTIQTLSIADLTGFASIPAKSFLVIFEDGTWTRSSANGEPQDTGTYAPLPNPWGFGPDTSYKIGVNLFQGSSSVDLFVANGADKSLFTGGNSGWLGAGSTALAALSLLIDNNTFSGLIGNQQAVLDAIGVTRPDADGDTVNPMVEDSHKVFARVYEDGDSGVDSIPGDAFPIDTNQELDWTTSNDPTELLINQAPGDINPQDVPGGDDLDPAQGAGTNDSIAGQTVVSNDSSGGTLEGGRGPDFLFGHVGNDTLFGGDHNDFLFGNAGNDRLWGGKGADLLVDVDGQDLLVGESGDDILIAHAPAFPEVESVPGSDAADILIGDNIVEASDVQFNVALLIDISASMNSEVSDGVTRLDIAKEAVSTLLTQIADSGATVNLYVQTFSTDSDTPIYDGAFTSGDLAGLLTAVNGLTTDGFTNYEAPLADAQDWFVGQVGATDGFTNIAYFLTDGVPNRYLDDSGNVAGSGTGFSQTALDNAVAAIDDMLHQSTGTLSGDDKVLLHAIGMGTDVSTTVLDVLDNTNVVDPGPPQEGESQVVNLEDASELTAALLGGGIGDEPVGHDVIIGGDGADFIFGDNLAVPDETAFLADPFTEIENVVDDDALITLMNSIGVGDWIDGGAGNDFIMGQGGDDEILGGAGEDTIHGGFGDDTIHGGGDDDTIDGGAGNDSIEGDSGTGNDSIFGGIGNDTLIGGPGADTVQGGDDDDVIHHTTGEDTAGNDYDGGLDTDTLVLHLTAAEFAALETHVSNLAGFIAANSDPSIDTGLGTTFASVFPASATALDLDAQNFEALEVYVDGVLTEINLPPDANNDIILTNQVDGAPFDIPLAALLANDTDPNGDPLTVTSVFGALGGTVTLEDTNGDGIDDVARFDPTLVGTPDTEIDENFAGTAPDLGGFTYVDDFFGGTGAFADGTYAGAGNGNAGALHIDLGGVNNSSASNMNGAFTRDFTLAAPALVTITFDYRVQMDSDTEDDEDALVLARVGGIDLGPGGVIDELEGSDGGGPDHDSGWQTFSQTVLLGAGTHTLVLGGLMTGKTQSSETVDIDFDNVLVESDPAFVDGSFTYTAEDPDGLSDTAEAGIDGQSGDTVVGTAAAEILVGTAGADSLVGNGGNDYFVGHGGNDTLIGGSDNDTLRGGAGNDSINGAGGVDLLDFGDGGTGVTFTLQQGAGPFSTGALGAGLGTDSYANIEGVIGTDFDDSLTGSSSDDVLIGGGGADTIDGMGGNDFIEGDSGAGNDSLLGGAGDDTILGNAGDDTIIGGPGSDSMSGGDGADRFVWQSGDDVGPSVDFEYDFAGVTSPSSGHLAFEFEVTNGNFNSLDALDPTSAANDYVNNSANEAAQSQYDAIESVGSTSWTAPSAGNNNYQAMWFQFDIDEDQSIVTQLDINVRATRPDGNFNDDLMLGIWNDDTNDWEELSSQNFANGTFGDFNITLNSNLEDYIDNNGHLTLVLFNEDQHTNSQGATDGQVTVDFVGVTVSAPGGTAVDIITDFTPGSGGDVLDIDALLPGSVTGATTVSEIDNYLDFTYDDPTQTTTMHVDPDGAGAGGVSQEIKIEGLDLTDGGANSDQDIIASLIADGNLVV